jgi:hypothetical protein
MTPAGLRVAFGTIFLNECGLLPLSLKQHYTYCDKWVLVEGADQRYPKRSVDRHGLSVDGSHERVLQFPDPDKKITLVRKGWSDSKIGLRNEYAKLVDDCDVLIVIDVDEFLTHASMQKLIEKLDSMSGPGTVRIPHVHFWKDQQTVVKGGYWDVPHDRAYRWLPGCRYMRDHNHPELKGKLLRDNNTVVVPRRETLHGSTLTCEEPYWLHYANCRPSNHVRDKNDYYISRGERRTRPATIESREAFFAEKLPTGLSTLDWAGPWPEVMIPQEPNLCP